MIVHTLDSRGLNKQKKNQVPVSKIQIRTKIQPPRSKQTPNPKPQKTRVTQPYLQRLKPTEAIHNHDVLYVGTSRAGSPSYLLNDYSHSPQK